MNLKLIFLMCSLLGLSTSKPFFGINVQITGADYTPATTAETNMNNSLITASTLIKLLPLQTIYLYKGSSDFWIFNDYATYFVGNVANSVAILNNVFRNITKAAGDNTNFPGVFTGLQLSVSEASGFLGSTPYPWATTIPDYIMANIQIAMNTEMTTLASLLEQTYNGINDFKSSGLALTSANVLKYIPNQVTLTASLKNMANYTGQFLTSVTNATKNLNNTYNLLKVSEPTLVAIEKQFNTTLNTTIAVINKTEADFNNTVLGFIKNINSTYNAFIAKIPATLKSNPDYISGLSMANDIFQQIVGISNSFKEQLYMGLESSKSNFSNMLMDSYYYQFISIINSIRLDIVSTTLSVSYNTYSCGLTAITAIEAKFKAIGAPAALTNCTNVLDMQLFTRLNTTLSTLLGLTYQDFTQASIMLSKCLGTKNVTTSSTNPPAYPYSIIDCLKNMGGYLNNLPQHTSDTFTSIGSLLSSIGGQNFARMHHCIIDYMDFLKSAFYPIYNNYLICKAKFV